ncbi:TetR/AcrR family transcriptional regulator [Rhodococcus sp. AD45-ID]|uniref:TetR/AcrR family transcriptional regulator n=1 Tax=Rhodococcus TaxID=1827 RepID=UPI0005D4102F|nr:MULTISPECIES: TetR/AcrR family transcriptional regulator [Rhodococcus]KJF24939.1 mycofactocin system transcriptional regulator [Rhodococcus sp. AD45]PSR43166.1 TetR/AcrR family transcriptional regulator [Rhodococcus sp. AD45-ID]QXW00629.1 TetR/AcrR family transcriptional regulator [Rhodococcus globerulus]
MSDDATAVQFIDAGVASLTENSRDFLRRGLRIDDVVNQAGSSSATFFRKFNSKAVFVEAVLARLSESNWNSTDEVRDMVRGQLQACGNSLRPAVTALVAEAFRPLVDRSSVTENLLSHVFAHNHRGTAQAVKNDYVQRDALVLAAYEGLFEQADAAFRRPFTARSFAAAFNAILDGFRIRSLADPESVSATVVSDALFAFLGAVVDTSGRHQHLDDMVGNVDAPPSLGPLPRDPRAAILAAARGEFGKRGYFMTQVDDIADNAGVPRPTVKKLFPTKPHILVAALQGRVDILRETVADDVLIGLDEITIVENYMLRCAQLATDETEFMDALLVAVAHDTYGEPESLLSLKTQLNLPAIIAPVVQQGQDNGLFSTIGTPIDIAAGLTNALLLRCFTRRTETPEDNAAFVGGLLLRGLTRP